MIRVRKSHERGHFDRGWLDTRHTFSFDQYYDPEHMGFRALRVINEDRVAPAEGFPMHGHRDMEILTYVLEGALEHRDSMGNGSVMRPGEVQRMSAGTGVRHSEYNASRTEPVRLLQIWILPERSGLEPGYQQRSFADRLPAGELVLVASGDGRDGSVLLHQDVAVHAARAGAERTMLHALRPGRAAWIQVANGSLAVNGTSLGAGDGAAVENETQLCVTARPGSEFLIFDLA